MRRLSLLPVLFFAFAVPLNAQKPAAKDTASAKIPRIEDNSFLIEEAYNQEYGVVQEINNFQRTRDGNWAYTFTQEWPVPGQKNQFSYTVPVLRDRVSGTGIGDIALNYRYQALGADDEPLWFAPRLSVYLPSGNSELGRGAGGPALEVLLPVSYTVADKLVTHWNAGALITRADNVVGVTRTTRGLKAGSERDLARHAHIQPDARVAGVARRIDRSKRQARVGVELPHLARRAWRAELRVRLANRSRCCVSNRRRVGSEPQSA